MTDTFIKYTFGLGVPKAIFKLSTITSPYSGAAAMTSRLKDISMGVGMEEGIGIYVFIGIISFQITSYSLFRFYKNKVEKDRMNLKLSSTSIILEHINSYLISKCLCKRLKSHYLIPNY